MRGPFRMGLFDVQTSHASDIERALWIVFKTVGERQWCFHNTSCTRATATRVANQGSERVSERRRPLS